jgi:hypothetical protein
MLRRQKSQPLLVDSRCVRHQFEAAVDRCRTCDESFCPDCLVYSFGAGKPPFCTHCALAASGVRVRGSRPQKVSRSELRRREKEAQAAAMAAAQPPDEPIDWSIPGPEGEAVAGDGAFRWVDEPTEGARPGGIVQF